MTYQKPGDVVDTNTKAHLTVLVFAAAAVLTWHLALVATSDGLALGDVSRTWHALVRLHPLDASPSVSGRPSMVLAVGVWLTLLIFLVLLPLAGWTVLRSGRNTPPGMADPKTVTTRLGEKRVRSMARQTRPSLDGKKAPLEELGWTIGHTLRGKKPIIVSPEDHVMVLAPTGGGKSSQVLIPAALAAPGALIVTTTKVDILDVIAEHRASKGRVWVFDPLGRTFWPEPMMWDPVAGCAQSRLATARGGAFAAGLSVESGGAAKNEAFFADMASSVMSQLLHAADLDGRSMADVLDWCLRMNVDQCQEAQRILRDSTDPRAQHSWADLLDGAVTGAPETVSSTRMELQRMIRPLMDTEVLSWVLPGRAEDTFDPRAFVRSCDTLVLVSDDTAQVNVAPLTTMLFNEVIAAVKEVTSILPGGRLDPWMTVCGDEIANVAPLPKLPSMASELRGHGVHLLIAFQSDNQPVSRWGKDGAAVLTDNMMCEVVLPGIKADGTLERISRLVGSAEREQVSRTYGGESRGSSSSVSTQEKRIMRPDQVRQMPDGTCLVLARNLPPIQGRLTPWYASPAGKKLSEAAKRSAAKRSAHRESRIEDE